MNVAAGSQEQAMYVAQQGKNVVVEGRVQYHFLPESIKVYIKVEPEEGARRIWKDLQDRKTSEQRNEGEYASLEVMKKRIREREEEDAARYQKYYGIDHRDETQYGLVVDTTMITAEQATEKVLEYLRNKR